MKQRDKRCPVEFAGRFLNISPLANGFMCIDSEFEWFEMRQSSESMDTWAFLIVTTGNISPKMLYINKGNVALLKEKS